MHKLLLSLFLSSMIFIGSCASSCSSLEFPKHTVSSVLPLESFVKVEVILFAKPAGEQFKDDKPIELGAAVGSGTIIKKTNFGSYVLTAGHVCEIDIPTMPPGYPETKFFGKHKIYDFDNNPYDATVYKISNSIDACLLYVDKLRGRRAIKMKNDHPEVADMVYNIAAPAGYFGAEMVPIFQGRYSGTKDNFDVYTIPATGGSSGSPIINDRGYLIGMIFAVHRNFSNISFSPRIDDLYEFLEALEKAPQKVSETPE